MDGNEARMAKCKLLLFLVIPIIYMLSGCVENGECSDIYTNTDEPLVNTLDVQIASAGYGSGTWISSPDDIITSYSSQRSWIQFQLIHETCSAGYAWAVIRMDEAGDVSSVEVVYYSSELPECSVEHRVVVQELDFSCSVQVDMLGGEEDTEVGFVFLSCEIQILDDCPINDVGVCIPAGSQITSMIISGIYRSKMQPEVCD